MYYLATFENEYHFSDQRVEGEVLTSTSEVTLVKVSSRLQDMKNLFKLEVTDSEEVTLLNFFAYLFPIIDNSKTRDTSFLPDELWPKNYNISDENTFFGGSFNPWHEGHSECLRQCKEESIIIIPDYSPWKENRFDSALKQLENIHMNTNGEYPIYPGFISKQDRNPTCNWLPSIKGVKNWLMGDDTFYSFPRWKNVKKVIAALTKLYVVPREYSREDLRNVEEEIKRTNNVEIIYLAEHPYQSTSSSKLRESE